MWSWGLAEAPAGILHYLMHPWVMSTQKLADAGFTAEHGNGEILKDAAGRAASYVRFGRRRVTKKELVTAATGVGVVGALAAVRSARSRD
jgi:hypothetical protein